MVRGKRIRKKGKISFSEYFKKLAKGDKVAIVMERAVRVAFPKRLQGRTGTVVGERGKFKIIELKDKNKLKMYIIHPVHLKKI